jgi:lysophospholipase L1-like esterase
MKIIKIIFLNFLFSLTIIFIIELLFGYWFDKNNFGQYMREHRMKKNDYTLLLDGNTYNFTYERNYYGFIGEDIYPKDIKALFVGGSTADERYKPSSLSIVGNLNKKLSDKNINLKIINAGIEGQSTLGHLNNFDTWFKKLENFNPKIIIFYVGINDHLVDLDNLDERKKKDGLITNPDKKEMISDYLKSSSIFYDLLRKIKHKYYKSDKPRVVYDFDKSILELYKNKKFNFLNYDDALNKFDVKKIINQNQKRIDYYLKNIDDLNKASKNIGAQAIFINQLMSDGNNNEKLFILNYSLIKHCKKKNYKCIDLGKKLDGNKDFWWDGIHTTIKGSKEISNLIFDDLIALFPLDI